MDAPWQKEMAAIAQRSGHEADLSLARGDCTDEGDEFSPAIIEYSRLAALDAARSGLEGRFAQDCANSRDIKVQLLIADYFLDRPKESLIKKGIFKVVPDITERQLGKAEFFMRRELGVERMWAIESKIRTRRGAELEWMKREAERETGFKRDDPNPARREIWRKKYRALCNRDRK